MLKFRLSPSENRKSNLRIPSTAVPFTTPQFTHEVISAPATTYFSTPPHVHSPMLLNRSFYGFNADTEELTLGSNCKSNGVLRPYGDLLFAYSLTECDGKREMPPGYLIYKFVLHYAPLTLFQGRAHAINIEIECRFQRYFHVYQRVVRPTWETPTLRKRLKGRTVDFQIQLMDDEWFLPAKTQVYILGQTLHFQVSALHLPKGAKLFINQCYATTSNDPETSFKFNVIDNFGCMLESKRTSGGSGFVFPRTDNTIRFSIGAFQFTSDPDTPVYLHCKLHLTSEDPGPTHKFCTYIENRWSALIGEDSICECCDSKCVTSKPRRAMVEGFASSEPLRLSEQPSTPKGSFPNVSLSPDDGEKDYVWLESKLDGNIDPEHLLETFDVKKDRDEEQIYTLPMVKEKQQLDEDTAVLLDGEGSDRVQLVFRKGKIIKDTQGSEVRDSEVIMGEGSGLGAKDVGELRPEFPWQRQRVGLSGRSQLERRKWVSEKEEVFSEKPWIPLQEEALLLGPEMGVNPVSQEEVVSQSERELGFRVGDEKLLELPTDEGMEGRAERNEEKAFPLFSQAVEEELLGDYDGLVESGVDDGKDVPRVWHFRWR
ncbi:hypothetical protein UPYG_G00223930 [Umbra pygmaea]|uniref:ZP domain-containing protein n=1 Tax=Umbra pygmaea TaxID=75934 RepID=A0ABD0WDS0_UMBPY